MQIMAGMDQYSQYSSEAYTNGYQIWDMTTFIIVPRFSRDNLGCEVFYLKMLDVAQSSHIICSISWGSGYLILMLFNNWNRLLWLSTGLSIEDFHRYTGTDEILASIYNPQNDGNDKDNTKCRNTVICHIELALFFCATKSESQLTHVTTSGRQLRGEEEEDSSQGNVRQRDLRSYKSVMISMKPLGRISYKVDGPANDFRQDEWALG